MTWMAEAEPIARAYLRLAAEFGTEPRASEAAIRIALREADHLADDVYDVPAALFFALARTPRCFGAFRAMSVLVVEWHAKTLGFKLEASPQELGDLLVRVAGRTLDYDAVKAWFGERLFPYGG
jgi:hypothetical protein